MPSREVVGQLLGGRVAALGAFRKALQADRRQVARDQAVEPAWVGRLILDDLGDQPGEVPPERDLAGEELEEDDPQRVDVAASIGAMPLAGRLLGRHVPRGPHDPALDGEGRLVRLAAGQAEIHDDRLASAVDHDVRRLEVAVDDAGLVGVVQARAILTTSVTASRKGSGPPWMTSWRVLPSTKSLTM